jgi:Outer membrane protein beta-barrel domain
LPSTLLLDELTAQAGAACCSTPSITFDGPELQFFQPGAKASACTGLQASAAIAKAVAINVCFVRIRHAPFRLEGRRKSDAPNFPEDLKLFAHRHIRSSTPRHLAKSLSQQQISAPPLCKTLGSSIEMRRSAENQLHSGTDFTLSAPNFVPPFFATANRSTTRVGWTAGGGLQYAVTNNWWVFAEYRFSDFGTLRDNNLGASLPAGAFFNANRRLQENQVQAGFSYKFDTYAPVPVVAKY